MHCKRALTAGSAQHGVLRPCDDPPAEMAASVTEDGAQLDEAEDDDRDSHPESTPQADTTGDPAAELHTETHDGIDAVRASAAPADGPQSVATNGVAHAAGAASPPPPSSRPQQPSDSDDDDDLPLNARLLREPASDAATQIGGSRGRRDGWEGSSDEGLEPVASIDSAAALADAVISTVTGTSSVAAAAGAPLRAVRSDA